jgi:hypothetical protein
MHLTKPALLTSFVVLASAACSSASAEVPGVTSDEAALASAFVRPMHALETLPVIDESLHTTKAAARAQLPASLDKLRIETREQCAHLLGRPSASSFVRFDAALLATGFADFPDPGNGPSVIYRDTCEADLFDRTTTASDPVFQVFTTCPSPITAWCAAENLDSLGVLQFGAQEVAHGGFSPFISTRRGETSVVNVDLEGVARFIEESSDTSDAAVRATVPHVFVRFDEGAFVEVPGLRPLPHARGATFSCESLGSQPFLITVPEHANRVELYFQFERWAARRASQHDTCDQITLEGRTTDGFVSNFGRNFILPLR